MSIIKLKHCWRNVRFPIIASIASMIDRFRSYGHGNYPGSRGMIRWLSPSQIDLERAFAPSCGFCLTTLPSVLPQD